MNFYVLATIAGLTLLAALARTIPLSLKMYGSAAVFLFPALFLSSVRAQADYHLQIVKPTVGGFFGQRFLCAKPYSIAECGKQVVILQAALRRYPIEGLGQWTWVIVRSEDWKPILTRVQMDPNSPAFSILERHQTFFEEALLVAKPGRQLELLKKWNIPFDKFLDFAVSHELGHAFCGESDEIKAERSGQRLRKGEGPLCGKLQPNPTITVQYYKYPHASPAVLTGADREAGRILAEAGVRAVSGQVSSISMPSWRMKSSQLSSCASDTAAMPDMSERSRGYRSTGPQSSLGRRIGCLVFGRGEALTGAAQALVVNREISRAEDSTRCLTKREI